MIVIVNVVVVAIILHIYSCIIITLRVIPCILVYFNIDIDKNIYIIDNYIAINIDMNIDVKIDIK